MKVLVGVTTLRQSQTHTFRLSRVSKTWVYLGIFGYLPSPHRNDPELHRERRLQQKRDARAGPARRGDDPEEDGEEAREPEAAQAAAVHLGVREVLVPHLRRPQVQQKR